jgi:chromosome segregation protein
MYLKEIKTHGFKSFAEKITLELHPGITGIVGPNGSGKSNIVDAVRWVLGEQSIKSLRGEDTMTDVIFSGSKSREAMNRASVTLIFDNIDRYLPLDYNEVSIKRRVYVDGTNEYFINGEKCRLKDITSILLDTGIAKESFNIISQGKIEEIISNKPSERRIVFEEAAGVLKYKKRKEEALRKLEKTHLNMQRVNDVIHEIETNLEPLKEQSDKAVKFLECKKELEEVEIALITKDITTINDLYQQNKLQIDKINNELMSISTVNATNEAKIEEFRNKISNLDQKITESQKQMIDITTKVEQINSQKQIILERKKYEVDDAKIHANLVLLKENELKIKNDINKIELELNNDQDNLNKILLAHKNNDQAINNYKEKRNKLEIELANNVRSEINLKNKIDTLRNNIETNATLPFSAKSVLSNPKLRGIHNAIGNLIDVEEKYATAISTSLGLSSGFIVVDNEQSAKEVITYLKTNNLGRATFFPLNIIKDKYIDATTQNHLQGYLGFVGVASKLVKYDPKYQNIIANQLGNVIVASDLDSANQISKMVNYQYKIVTLDGELLHIGGSLTGGSISKNRNIISDKFELESNILELNNLTNYVKNIEEQINNIDFEIKVLEDKNYLISKEKINLEQIFLSKHNQINGLNDKLLLVSRDISGTNNMLNKKLSEEEESIINAYYEAVKVKDNLSSTIDSLNRAKSDLNFELDEYTFSLKKENNLFLEKSKELKNLEIEVNRMDVRLDNLLNTLTENYSITYEYALNNYHLDTPEALARNIVNKIKKEIKELGIVNIGAKEEYDRVSTRYQFLTKQKDDLYNAENTLLEIIKEMDTVMEKEFLKTFNIIKQNFTLTFKELFKGGHAELKLTDADNLLETGIEIIASPPGKKLTSISLLSGGEKTFTAISLLFAILKSRDVPFCILDEAEAALDEVNVDSFGEYITKLKSKTQFILITHKKKTMEFVDTLYGVTMQESGVSKLVSVKLENIKKDVN